MIGYSLKRASKNQRSWELEHHLMWNKFFVLDPRHSAGLCVRHTKLHRKAVAAVICINCYQQPIFSRHLDQFVHNQRNWSKHYKILQISRNHHIQPPYQVPSISTSTRWFQRCGDAPTALRLALRRALGWSQIFPEGGTTWGRTSVDPPELLVFGSPIWVCLKIVYP